MAEASLAVGPARKPAAPPKASAPAPAPSGAGPSKGGRKTAKEGAGAGRQGPLAPGASASGDAPGGLSPAEKARLAAVDARAGANQASVATHQSAKAATDDAQSAVKEPQSEADGKSRGDQAQHLEDNPPPDPEIVAKVACIKQTIRDKRPVKEDDLPKADPKAMASAAGHELGGDVQAAAGDVKQGYSGVDDKPKGTPAKDATPMPGDALPPPAPAVAAGAAAPDGVTPDQASVGGDKKAVDTKAKDAKLDRPEVKDISDGPVAAARDAQKDLAELAVWGPDAAVKTGAELRAGASADFAKAEAEALKKMAAARQKKLADVADHKDATKTGDEAKRDALGAKLEAIYTTAEDQVRAKLEPLVTTALKTWDDGIKPLSDNFDHALGRVDFYIKEHKDSFLNRFGDAIFGLPQWIVDEYENAEREFADGAGQLALTISSWVNGIIRDCQRLITTARKSIEKEIESLDPALRDFALQKQKEIGAQFDALSRDVDSAKRDFTKQLSQKLVSAVKEKDEKIQKLREESKGLVQKFEDAVNEFIDDPLRAIVNALLKIVGIPPDSFWALVDKLGSVVSDIADRPMVFANNLVAAIKLGFQQFKDNIVTHLIKGLLTWLTSKLKDAGVEPPKDLSLKSMITMFLQILGVTWPKIRAKLVKYIGEKNMRRIELAVEFLTAFINDGWDGVWNLIKQKLDPQQIVDIVLNAVKSFIIESIVKKAAEYIISLFNPAGVIYQALRLLYDAIAWVYENAARIFTFVEAVVNGAANIMAGAIGGAANVIEKALGMIVPIVIDLFAQLVGLGGVPDKVKEVVGGLQEMVSTAIDEVIAWVADMIGIQKDEKADDEEVGISVPIPAPDETHRLYIKVEGTGATVMVASSPLPVPERLADFRRRLPSIADAEKRARAESSLKQAAEIAVDVDMVADALVRKMKAGEGKNEGENDKASNKETELGALLVELYKLFGEHAGDERLDFRAPYGGAAGSGELSFRVTTAGRNVTVMVSGPFAGTLKSEMDDFASRAGGTRVGTKAAKARTSAEAAEVAGHDAINPKGDAGTAPDPKAAETKLDAAGKDVSAVAAYCRYDEGEVLQRVEEKVFEKIGAKVELLEGQVESDRTLMGAGFIRAHRRIVTTVSQLKAWGPSTPGIGIGKIRKTGELLATGVGKYAPDPESKSAIPSALGRIEDPAAFVADLVRAVSGELEDVATLKGVEKVHHKLVQRLVTLLHVEEARASGAWLQIMLAVAEQAAALAGDDEADLTSIYDSATFAHAEPGFVGEFRKNGARQMKSAAKKIFDKLGSDSEEYEILSGKQIMTPKQMNAIVDVVAELCVATLADLATWLGKQG